MCEFLVDLVGLRHKLRQHGVGLCIQGGGAGVVGHQPGVDGDIEPGGLQGGDHALVNPGAAIVTLDDISSVRVDFEVPDRYLASIREGQPITARIDGREWIDADCYEIAKNDGLNTTDFKEWFFGRHPKGDKVFHGVIIHFTDFRY